MADYESKKVALVTGAGRGIGRTAALALARAGFSLCLVSRSRDELLETRRLAGLAPEDSLIILLDLAQPDAPDVLMTAAIDHFGRIDVLVNAAGFSPPSRSLVELDPEHQDRIVAVNLRTPIALARMSVAMMLPRGGGSIINVVRGGAKDLRDGGSVHLAARSGVIAFTRSSSEELRGRGIKVCAIIAGGKTQARVSEDTSVIAEMIVRMALAPADESPIEIELVDSDGD